MIRQSRNGLQIECVSSLLSWSSTLRSTVQTKETDAQILQFIAYDIWTYEPLNPLVVD
jgi:hypothetical protein